MSRKLLNFLTWFATAYANIVKLLIRGNRTIEQLNPVKIVIQAIISGDPVKVKVERLDSTSSFEDWLKVYDAAPPNSKLRETACKMMAKVASTFSEWRQVYDFAPYGSKACADALRKMAELARTFKDWKIVYKAAHFNGKLQLIAEQRIQELGQSSVAGLNL